LRYQVEPQEKKKTPKGRAKKRITYTRRFVNVTMTGGKRKVRSILILRTQVTTDTDKAVDEPQPYFVNNFRNWSLSDGAKAGTRIANSLATPSIHYWAARPSSSPGTHDDDSKFWQTCIADRLLSATRTNVAAQTGLYLASLVAFSQQRLRLLNIHCLSAFPHQFVFSLRTTLEFFS